MADRTLVDAEARRRAAAELDRTIFVEAGAGSGKTTILVERVVALVDSGLPITAIAAITFTERAGAELRNRLRRRFAELARDSSERCPDPGQVGAPTITARWSDALADLDGASIGTIHSFAQQVLASHPLAAGLPPRFEVLDESASAVAFERRWRAVAHALYERGGDGDSQDDDVRRAVQLALALEVTPRHLRQLTRTLDEAWDLTTARLARPLPLPTALLDGPLRSLRSDLRAVGALAECSLDPTEDRLAQHLRTMTALADELDVARSEPAVVAALREAKLSIGNKGLQNNWVRVPGGKPEIAAQLSRLDAQVKAALAETSEAVLTMLAYTVGQLVGAHAAARRRSGRLEFHDLLVLARDLLRDRRRGAAVRRALHERFRAVLIDEFQDTDPLQFELASLITASPDSPFDGNGSDDGNGDGALPEPVPGRLFLVGDPKQSIYRFRRADLGLYLQTRDRLAGTPLALQTNFRATRPIVAWLNAMFGHLIVAKENSQAGYVRLSSGRPDAPSGPAVTTLGGPHLDGKIPAEELRWREALDVASVITNAIAQAWQTADVSSDGAPATRPLRYADIAILLPTRTSLPAIEQALGRAGIPARIEASTLLWAAPEVAELVAVAAAAARPDDELGVVTALRTTLLGASDADLYRHRVVHSRSFALRPARDGNDDHNKNDSDTDDPVAAGLAALHRWSLLATWAAPSTLLTTIADEGRAFELAALAHRPREPMRRLRLALEQTRAFTDSTGATVEEWLNWIERQRVEGTRVGEPLLPEDDDDAVRLLTIHAAKGLEFPMVVVAGLTTQPGGPPTAVNVIWPPDGSPPAIRLSRSMSSASFDDARDLDNQLDDDERVRLLYVACTRARDHLAVSVHHLPDGPRTLAFLLAEATDATAVRAAPLAEPALALRPATTGLTPTPPPPWEPLPPSPPSSISVTALAAALAPHPELDHIQSTSAATEPNVANEVETDTDTDADAALIRRAAATALGQAVHRTLELADAADPDGVSALATHAACEQGLAASDGKLVAHLARVALDTPIMRAVADGAPHWRELYVALPVAGRVLEGYIDLLVRTPDGLVVVDYKTDADPPPPGGPSPAHRIQLAAYAHALTAVTGEHVASALAIYCRDEAAPERRVTDLAATISEVTSALAAGTGT